MDPPSPLSSSLCPLPPQPLPSTGRDWELATERPTDSVQGREGGAAPGQLQAGRMTGQREVTLVLPEPGAVWREQSRSGWALPARPSRITVSLGFPHPPWTHRIGDPCWGPGIS